MAEEKESKVKIVQRKILELKAADYNPRKILPHDMGQLMKSLTEFGAVDPAIVNMHKGRDNIIIGGHQRISAAKKLGWKEFPCVELDLELEKEKELNLRLNRNVGQWDFDLLGKLEKELLELTGFEESELEKALKLQLNEDLFDAEKEAEKIIKPKTKRGDIYILGKHRLMCGDSQKEEAVKKLMNGEQANLIYTDPPFGVDYNYTPRNERSLNKDSRHHHFDDDLSKDEYYQLILKATTSAFTMGTDNCYMFLWFATKNAEQAKLACSASGWKWEQTIIWLKNSLILTHGQMFHRIYEPCLVMRKGKVGKSLHNTMGLNWHEALLIDRVSFQEWLDVLYEKRDSVATYVHPTQKPIKLAERPIKRASFKNDIVLDLFGGSGSTLMCCEQLERRAFLMEIDPVYCDVIVKRWETTTGRKAKKA